MALACGFMASCNSNTYTINGVVEIPELEGRTVYRMWSDIPQGLTKNSEKDSTVITNGKFTFKGEVTNPNYCNLYIPGDNPRVNDPYLHTTVVMEKGNISLLLDADKNDIVSGTPLNDILQKHENEYRKVQERLYKSYNVVEKAKKDGLKLKRLKKQQLLNK